MSALPWGEMLFILVIGVSYFAIVMSLTDTLQVQSPVWIEAGHSKVFWTSAFVFGLVAPIVGIGLVFVYQLVIHKDLAAARNVPASSSRPATPSRSPEVVAASHESVPTPGFVADLQGLADLHVSGALTDDEYQIAKRQLITGAR